jgi:regulatory protein
MQGKQHRPRFNTQKRQLDAAKLESLALFYVARFATTQVKLTRYLERKLREAEWGDENAPNIIALVARMTGLGFVDDASYADAKAGSLTRRGYGARRVSDALRHAGVGEADTAAVLTRTREAAHDAALIFARKRRFGPFATTPPSPEARQKQIAAFCRAGHDFEIACNILDLNIDFVQDENRSL